MIGQTLTGAFDKIAGLRGESIAVQDNTRHVSYRELRVLSEHVASGLYGLGVRPGDRVALWMYNCVEYVIAELAIARLGCVRVPLNHLLDDEEVIFRIVDSGAELMICGPEFEDRSHSLSSAGSDRSLRVVCVHGNNDRSVPWATLEAASAGPNEVSVHTSDRAAIMYTGGTTGRSKGVVHTHDTILATSVSSALEWELNVRSVLIHATPLPHGAGFMVYAGLMRGARNVLMPKFDVETYLRCVEREQATFGFLVPTMLYMLLDSGRVPDFDVSSFETILYGAAPMAPARVEEAIAAFGPVLVQAYAQMEAINQATLLTKQDHVDALAGDRRRLASCGRPGLIPSVRVVDDGDRDVAPGEVGEVIIKSPHVMREYWLNPTETSRALRSGWLHTGDLATVDDDGFVFIVDRARDVVISGGMNVYSTKVEAVLFEHPAVTQAAVFAVPDEKWGEAVRAHVVLRDGQAVSVDDLLGHCRAHLAGYEIPKQLTVVDELPLTPYGKIDKKALRAPFWASEARQVG